MKKSIKKVMAAMTVISLFASISASAVEIESFSEELSVYDNGNNVYANSEYKPIIVNDRTMVQIKPIFELMGFESKYDDASKKATFSKDGDEFEYSFIADEPYIYKFSALSEQLTTPTVLDVPALLYKDTFYVPLRAFCETLDMDIDWVDAERKVVVTNDIVTPVVNALSFNNFVGEWGDISSMYLAQSMGVAVNILDVNESDKTIKLAYKYKMGVSGVWDGGEADYCEPITVSYHEEEVNVESNESGKTECKALVTEPISIVGYNKDVSNVVDGTQLCRITLVVPGNGNLYYAHGTTTTCLETQKCTPVK